MAEVTPRVAVVQDGARLHYAVPLALYQAGMLERVFCGWYSAPGSLTRLLSQAIKLVKPAVGQRMLDRFHPGLTGARIVSNAILSLKVQRQHKRFASDTAFFIWDSQVKAAWMERAGFGAANAVFGFIRNLDPEFCARARQNGLVTIGDQMIAPYAVERAEWHRQAERFPEFVEGPLPADDDRWIAREQQTWDALDGLTCASDYVREGLISMGIAPERIVVNPYPADVGQFPVVDRARREGPVTVGFVGRVNLRKGTPYFFDVARRFDPARVRFVMVGPVDIPPAAVEKYRGHVELPGAVTRSEVPAWMGRFDVFLFPSTCEGSAGAVSEAMATGLPVICSPNAGSVIRDGVEGFILPYDDVDGMARRIEELAASAALRQDMGKKAAQRVRELGLEPFSALLATFLRSVMARK